MAQIALDRACVDAIVCQFVAAAMPQHVRVDLDVKARRAGRTLYHGLEAPRRKRRIAFAHKYERRLECLLAL